MLVPDYTLNNPDTLTKYKTAAQISEKVLAEVSKLCVPGSKIVDICEKGDKLIEEELSKVYRGKKVTKGAWSAEVPATAGQLG
jgi:methionine aminopeptidase